MKKLTGTALLIGCTYFQSLSAAATIGKLQELPANDPRLKEEATQSLTPNEVLNGTIKWNLPVLKILKYDLTGFDASKLGKTPGVGIHPRLFTSPQELPAVKAKLEATETGRKLVALARRNQKDMQSGKGIYGKAYETLKTALLPEAETKRLYVGMMNELAVQALFAQLYDETEPLKETGIVAGNLIRSFVRYFETIPHIEGHEGMVNEAIYWSAALPLLYDFTAPALSKEDRKFLLNFMVRETNGKYSDGMNLPSSWRMWNHIAMSLNYPFTLLAFEKEAKFDTRIYARGKEMAEDYYTFQFSPEGMSTEGQNYTLGQSTFNVPFIVAMARRGEKNLLAHPHVRATLDWYIHTLSPNPNALWETGGDTGTRGLLPYQMMMIFKTFYPNDPKVDYLLANAMPDNFGRNTPNVATYIFCCEPQQTKNQYNGVPPLEMPLTYYVDGRGFFSTRDRWNREGVKFTLEARRDTYFPSHDHSDRGAFTLSANGRNWVVDGFRSTQTNYHANVLIDGRGQGYFATPASWLDFKDLPEATVGVIDIKYCYDWSWLKSPVADDLLDRPVSDKWKKGVYGAAANNLRNYFPGIKPQRDPLEAVAEMYSGNLYRNALIWKEDTWPMRIPNCEVQYAFRTAGLIKGKHTYALIVDDIRKDDRERLYEWQLPMPLDIELVTISQLVGVKQESGALNIGFNTLSGLRQSGEYDMVLGDKRMKRDMREVDNEAGWEYKSGRFTPSKGDPQLLVRVLDKQPAPRPNLEPNPSLQTIEHLKTEDMHQFYLRTMGIGKRLVVPARGNNPHFKVLLFPYRHGEELPQTRWNDDRTVLTVSWKDQIDIFTFRVNSQGRTELSMNRNGKKLF